MAILIITSALLMLVGGCKTKPPAHVTYTFFPPSPDEPRVQFLTSFSSDLELGRTRSFADYITGTSTEVGRLVKPYGVNIKDGKLYVCDTVAGVIQVFDIARKRGRYFAPVGEGHLQTPVNITLDSDGTRYVADTGRNQVLIFAKDDTWIATIGTKDEIKPADIALTQDRIYVTDVKGHCVRVYGKADRKFLFTVPRDPKSEPGKLFTPTCLALDPQGRLVVTDTGAFAVQVYDLEGKFLRTIGQQGVAPGLFARPKGVAVDRESRVFVVDAATQVVQMFDSEGKLLMYFGAPGASTQGDLYLPAAVKVDYQNVNLFKSKIAPGFHVEFLILVINQFGAHKVNVYGFGHKG